VKINSYHSVKSLEEAYKLLNENKQNAIVAGGAWMRLSSKEIETAIDLSELGIDQIVETNDSFEIGSMATLRQVEKHEGLKKHYDGALSNALSHIMGVPIRNVATIGGSIIGKYSFSDVLTPLVVMDVELEFYKKGRLSLEDFLISKNRSKDVLVKVIIKKEEAKGYFKKMQKTGLDFAVVNVAVSKQADTIKIAVGARPSLVKFAVEAMAFVNGAKEVTEEVILETAEIAGKELKFGTNSKASESYRRNIAMAYIKRGLREVTL
jgi:CO/xanthine dehydrogenase FAD-binding subunit